MSFLNAFLILQSEKYKKNLFRLIFLSILWN
ncbi:hypothetical protein QF028_002123 [Neobacillus sp. B4I6]